MRDTAPPGPAPVGIGAVAGMPNKRGGIQIEGQVEQQQQRYQLAAHPLLADVDFETVQGLFDANMMVEDSAFRDFVGALFKLGDGQPCHSPHGTV